MLDCNGIHRLLGGANAIEDKLSKFLFCHLKKRAIVRDIPEVLEEGHGSGQGRVVGRGV